MSSGAKCHKCGSTIEEIFDSGFVGCEECYDMPEIQEVVDKMFAGKTHKE
ncbi:MAG: hypothetical protein IJ817_02625 [Clostridia bacterium]|nr:hypothetical protein [Clostridia bacterium]